MKRILHIPRYYHPVIGGTEQTARDCVNVLKNTFEQKVLCFNWNIKNEIDKVDGVEVIRCGSQCKMFSQPISMSLGSTLKKVIKEFDPEYILFHYPSPFTAYYLLKYIPRNTKLILYWHLDITKQKTLGKLVHFQNLKLLSRAYKVIATSFNYIENSPYLSSVKNKCIVIPSCINENRLAIDREVVKIAERIKKENKEKIICLAVGRHVAYKGFEYLIKASARLNKKFVFYIAGQGKLTEKLKEIAAEDKKINFIGAVDDIELKAYFVASDIFCFPSITKNEAFGLALAEAMYFELPVVTFTIPGSGVNYVSLNKMTGIEVENRSDEKFSEALQTLAEDEKLRKEYGQNGRKRVEENFLFQQYKERILDFFEKDAF